MKEWKDIVGYEGLYQVSNTGDVRSVDRYEEICNRWGGFTIRLRKGKNLTPSISKNNNYYGISLIDSNGNEKRWLVHRLVALAFVDIKTTKNYVNHIDGDKLNNKSDNLEWVTRSENMAHALATGLSMNYGSTHYRARKVVNQATGEIYGSIKEASAKTGISNSYLKGMLSGHNKNISSIRFLSQSN